MSLREQLLKSGLISKDKAQKAEKSKKHQQHSSYKDKNVKAQIDAENKQRLIELQAFDEAKKIIDLEKNREIELIKQIKANKIEARKILLEHRVNDKDANDRFNFCPDGKKIRFVLVTSKQRLQLGNGELAICRNDKDGFDYPLIPIKHALRLQEFEKLDKTAKWILLLNTIPETSEADSLDEWKAWDLWEKEQSQ